jgi:hypothetical protein
LIFSIDLSKYFFVISILLLSLGRVLTIKPETLKQLQEEGNTLEHIGIGNDFVSRTPVAQQIRGRMNKKDSIKIKKLLHSKRNSH